MVIVRCLTINGCYVIGAPVKFQAPTSLRSQFLALARFRKLIGYGLHQFQWKKDHVEISVPWDIWGIWWLGKIHLEAVTDAVDRPLAFLFNLVAFLPMTGLVAYQRLPPRLFSDPERQT